MVDCAAIRFVFPYELEEVPAEYVEVDGRVILRSNGWRLRRLDG